MERDAKKITVHCEIVGEGFPLVVLHALGADHRSMKAWMEPVFVHQAGWQRIYIDIPAHGRSGIHDSIKTTEDMLEAILGRIDALLPEKRFALVGSFTALIERVKTPSNK